MSKILSGNGGTVLKADGTPYVHITKWSFDPSVVVNKWNSNTSGGAKDANCGSKDSKGSIEVTLDISKEADGTITGTGVPWGVGEMVTLDLLVDKDVPAHGIRLDAIIAASPLECDIDGGTRLMIKYDYEGRRIWQGRGLLANI